MHELMGAFLFFFLLPPPLFLLKFVGGLGGEPLLQGANKKCRLQTKVQLVTSRDQFFK
jgi:hypothetical protein